MALACPLVIPKANPIQHTLTENEVRIRSYQCLPHGVLCRLKPMLLIPIPWMLPFPSIQFQTPNISKTSPRFSTTSSQKARIRPSLPVFSKTKNRFS